jgi:uncharacterized protein (TIGR02302 family)
METSASTTPTRNPAFEAKIRKARLALVAEQLWLRLWVLFALAGLFALISFAGVWPLLSPLAHKVTLGLFGLAGLAWLIFAARIRWPSRDDAIRRIEAVSGIPHRPATSYEDSLTASAEDPTTQAIWAAHRQRMADLIKRLRPGRPSPRTHRFDPLALRALAVLGVVLGVALAGRAGLDNLMDAFRIDSRTAIADQRLDAWVTPPAYTGRAPVMLVDGSTMAGSAAASTPESADVIEVPENSSLIVRASGPTRIPLTLEVWLPGAAEPMEKIDSAPEEGPAAGVTEVRTELESSATIKVQSNSHQLASWPITIIPDNIPGIALTKNPERTTRGALKLTYFVQDDYGVASAEVKFARIRDAEKGDPATAWARGEELKGPRPPFSRPPQLSLRLPSPNAKQGEAFTYHEIGSHPWAGQKVMMTLEAKDVAGQIGRSPSMEIVLPERPFTKPLARALIEQRKLLIEDPRYADRVRTAIEALTLAPEGFIDDPRVYLPLRATMYRLERSRTRAGLDASIDQLWQTALRIEDGDLSEAEKNLRDIQDRLAKALEDGASDEEIRQLMQELREAFQEFAKQMQQQNGGDEQQNADGQDQNNQQLSSEDIDRMMREMEQMAESGMREQAKDMLAQMRDLMERMRQGQQNAEQQRQNKEMQDAIRKLGEAVGEQQSIMDDTFEEGRNQQQQGQGGQPMRQTQPGQKGQRGQGMQADRRGSIGQGDDQGEMGLRERGRDGEGQGNAQGQERRAQLAQRQAQLRERLEAMRRDMQQKGLGNDERLGEATDAMQQAEDALGEGDLDEANAQQGRALDQMRESAQEMAQQMQQNSEQRYGQNGDSPRDPFGRPQRSQGPDQGRSVKVPDQIDVQRAREVLEELRRRAGEAKRPQIELDYIERLLKWY